MDMTQRYRIVRVGKADAFYRDRDILIGQEGVVTKRFGKKGNWMGCDFTFDDSSLPHKTKTTCFFKILLKKLET